MHRECLSAIKSLRSNSNIVITKPDKGSGVVILNKTDYVKKMNSILEDETKFLTLGPSSKMDNASKIESRIQRRLLQLHKEDLLPANLYDLIRPTGSQRPRMYGLPKTHKKDVPLRPILSMTGSAQHQLAKYLSSLLEPALTLYSSNCIRDSFTFADIIKTSNLDPFSVFLCSFDISSLFTNVPLAETIQICADALYSSEHLLHLFHGKSSSNLWRWLLLLLSLALMTSCIAKSTESPWDHLLDQPLPIFLLATTNLNFFRPLQNRRCITAIWMTPS